MSDYGLEELAEFYGLAGQKTLTVAEVLPIVKVSERNLREQIRRGSFPCVRIGRRVVIPVSDFLEWLTARSAA